MLKAARKILILPVLLLFIANTYAQMLGNEWINYSQQYYKFPVTKAGIYHITQATLVSAGIPAAGPGFDPRNIQVFYRGQEIPLYIQGEADGVFDPADFIEFFGEGNDGWLDTTLYVNGTADQVNPGYSMFNDTSVYYFTWNTSTNNLRYIQETDTDFPSYTPASYYFYRARQSLQGSYYEGEVIGGTTISEYTYGEGYCNLYDGPNSYTASWSSSVLSGLKNTIYTGGPDSYLRIHALTANNPVASMAYDHHHQVTVAGTLMLDTSLTAYNFYKRGFTVNSASLSTSSEAFRIDFLGTYSAITRNGIGYYELLMPQTFDLSNRYEQFMYLPDAASGTKSRLDITNFNNAGSNVWIYDLTNARRILVVNNAGTQQALVPNTGNTKKMFISSEAFVNNIPQLLPVSTDPTHYARFRDFTTTFADRNYVIIAPPKLMTEATIYNNYRLSIAGGSYQSLLIDVNEIYDQFGFGIRIHPTAVRNFLKMTNTTWSVKPEHVFLVGKSIKHNFIRQNATLYAQSLLPSIGVNACDNLFAYDIDGTGRIYCGIGRLSASNGAGVMDYYDKVVTHESTPTAEWMKNVLHFGGGGADAALFLSYLNGYKDVIEDTLYGGHVTTFIKTSSAPFSNTVADTIKNYINNIGVSLITVFGHSSGQGFDQNVEEPESFLNYGKYPWYIVNGCLSGDIFQSDLLISERFILAHDKGAIGFIASTSLGFASTLRTITDSLYQNISVDNYGRPMGVIHKNAISENVAGMPYYSVLKMNALDMQLHGDPAVKFNRDTLPDLDLKINNVSFEPGVVTTELDSFTIRIIVNNLGRTISSPYILTVSRDFPEPGIPDSLYTVVRPGIYYKDTVELTMPISLLNSFGENVFTITADPTNFYQELSEMNNQIVAKLNIISSDIVPVYPYKYAVVPVSSVPLKASTGDAFAPLRTYKFEIDTTDLFNSPFKRDTVITQIGGVLQWQPNFTYTDSTVYFWRTGVDSANTGNFYRWKESSFQYIPGKYGWGQDHFFQFKNDEYLYINDNRANRRFEFVPNAKELKIITYPVPYPGDGYQANTKFLIDGFTQESSGCYFGNQGLFVFVIDPVTMQPWGTNYGGANPDHVFGETACRGRVEYYFQYYVSSATQATALANMLASVPNDYYIGAYTFSFSPPNFANWQPALVSAFQSLGADLLPQMVDSGVVAPYIFYTRKGDTASTVEVVGADGTTPIELSVPLENDWYFGTITSELVGPASEWKSFHWQTHSLDADPGNDSSFVSIIGVKADGSEDMIVDRIYPTTTDLYTLGDSLNANTYPYLKLFMFTRDDSTQTPAQLDHWHVMYEGVPECALNPAIQYYFYGDTLAQGEQLTLSTAIENIGDYDMDSLLIRYFIVDKNHVTHDYFVKRDSLRIGEFIIDTFQVSTSNYGGINSFYIEANPLNHPQHQLEQFHFNNIAVKNLVVNADNVNPILDVTFDGMHIMDGDIVSGKPLIHIQLKDESVYQLLNDTGDFELFLKWPNQANATKINFSNPEVTFYPATTPGNYAKIELRPDLTTVDGIYELRIRARDRNQNESGEGDGDYDYKIKFEVVNRSTITHIFNYPNPFSTSTQWVFTLTGSELPSQFTIRIMTISGVVVREITLDELGPIHIGKNITQFKWNGTDEYGDKLATGVYIYQVITKINGEVIDHRSTSADKYFKNNFGKLYILR